MTRMYPSSRSIGSAGPAGRPDDAFQAQWLAYAPRWFTTDADSDAPTAVIQLVASDQYAVIEVGDGEVRTSVGRAADPDLGLDGPPRAVLGLLVGVLDIDGAISLGLTLRGRRDVLTRLRPVVGSVDGPLTGSASPEPAR